MTQPAQALIASSPHWQQVCHDGRQRMIYIQRLCERIAARFCPERIILFGSQASGQATQDSDIDLLVILPFEGRHTTQAIRIVNELNALAPIDLLVRRPEQIRERLRLGDSFVRGIFTEGRVMYEADHAGMD